MKKTLLSCLFFLFIFSSISSRAQASAVPMMRWSSATVNNNYEIKQINMDSIQSMLFVFEGDGKPVSGIYYFLSNRLKRQWNKKVKLGFQFDIQHDTGEEVTWMNLPKYQSDVTQYDLRVELRSHNFKTEVNHAIYQESYLVDVQLIDPKTNGLIEYAQLEVISRGEDYYDCYAIPKLLDLIIKE